MTNPESPLLGWVAVYPSAVWQNCPANINTCLYYKPHSYLLTTMEGGGGRESFVTCFLLLVYAMEQVAYRKFLAHVVKPLIGEHYTSKT